MSARTPDPERAVRVAHCAGWLRDRFSGPGGLDPAGLDVHRDDRMTTVATPGRPGPVLVARGPSARDRR